MIRLLKLVDDPEMTRKETLAAHLGWYLIHGKVTYGTDIPVRHKPKYVLFVLGNVDNICYLCRVEKHSYRPVPCKADHISKKGKVYADYLPDFYTEEHKTWFVFNSMQEIPIDFLEQLLSGHADNSVIDFIKTRANNKRL